MKLNKKAILRWEVNNVRDFIIIIIIIMEKTEAGLRGLCIREIDAKSQELVHKIGLAYYRLLQ